METVKIPLGLITEIIRVLCKYGEDELANELAILVITEEAQDE